MMSRRFLALVALCLSASVLLDAQTLRMRARGRVGSGSSSGLSLITLNDWAWDGGYQIPASSAGTLGGSFSPSYGEIAIRYTNSVPASGSCKDNRRLLIPAHIASWSDHITGISTGNGTQTITVTSAHNLTTGRIIYLLYTDSTPSIDGSYAVTVTGANTFTVNTGINVTVAGTGAGIVNHVNETAVQTLPRTWGDLVEWCEPSSTSRYTGANWGSAAPELLEVRRWPGDEWAQPMDGENGWGDYSSGNQIGGLEWDETNQVLRYGIYGYYHTNNMPTYGATQLLNSAHASLSGYKATGTKYGPWFYRSTTPGAIDVEWKAINNGMSAIPASAQADLGGRTYIACGTVGAVQTAGTKGGHVGQGIRAINMPALATTPYTVMFPTDNSGIGVLLADYTEEFGSTLHGLTRYEGRRPGTYTRAPYNQHFDSDTGLRDKENTGLTGGFSQMSLDQSNGCSWVEDQGKQGVVQFGRMVTGVSSYGYNPISRWPFPISSISSSGTTVTARVVNHKMLSGATATIACISPSGYAGTYTVTVTDADHFTYTTAGSNLGAASFSSSGSSGNNQPCASGAIAGQMVVSEWDTRVNPDATDAARFAPGDSDGYVGEIQTGVMRIMDPAVLRDNAKNGSSPFNDHTNWNVSSDIYAKWPNLPKYSTLDAGNDSSGAYHTASGTRINQLSVAVNGMKWDATGNAWTGRKELVWCIANSATDGLTISGVGVTCQFFHVQ